MWWERRRSIIIIIIVVFFIPAYPSLFVSTILVILILSLSFLSNLTFNIALISSSLLPRT